MGTDTYFYILLDRARSEIISKTTIRTQMNKEYNIWSIYRVYYTWIWRAWITHRQIENEAVEKEIEVGGTKEVIKNMKGMGYRNGPRVRVEEWFTGHLSTL